VTHAAKGVGYLKLSMGFSCYQDALLVGKSGVGVERFVDCHFHVEKLIIYHVPSLYTPVWFGHVQRMEENRIPKRVLYINLETTILRGRVRNRWQDEVREDGRIVGGEECQEKVYNREEWKKLLRTVRNRRILHMPVE
jgi:hypothetical protein